MWLEISKRCTYSLHPTSGKHYVDIAYLGGIQAITFLGNHPSFVALWNFNMGIDGES